MTIYIVRHGQTDWNLENRCQGLSDIELNQTGISQAEKTREKLSSIHFDVCYTSTLRRARKTAEIIIGNQCDIIPDSLLVERDSGDKEGTIMGEFGIEKYRDEWDLKLNSTKDNVEPILDMFARAQKFLKKLGNVKAQNVLIVTHGGFSKALHYSIVGYNENTNLFDWHLQNCEFSKYEL